MYAFKSLFVAFAVFSSVTATAQSPIDTAMNKWVAQNDFGKWALCSATAVEIRAATAGSASEMMTKKLNMLDSTMRIARAKFVEKGTPNPTLDKLQQSSFNQNKTRTAQEKGAIMNDCIDSLDKATR